MKTIITDAVGDRTMLNQLYEQLQLNLLPGYPHLQGVKPVYRDFRAGDVRHSLAGISKAAKLLGYHPTYRIGEGLKVAMKRCVWATSPMQFLSDWIRSQSREK